MSLPHWLREHVQVTDQAQEESEYIGNILNFPRGRTDQRADDGGQSALDLVYQAAELVSGMQEEARRRETRAQTLCRSAVEKLRLAERRVEAAETALSFSESRLSSAETRLAAAELREERRNKGPRVGQGAVAHRGSHPNEAARRNTELLRSRTRSGGSLRNAPF
jgi:hypothetical protein